MRSRITVLGSMSLISLFCFGQAGVFTSADGNTQILKFRAPLIGNVAVPGAPYSGEWIADHRTPANRLISRNWRDSAGRTRGEFWIDGFLETRIEDPIARIAYLVEDSARTVHRAKLNSVGFRSDGRPMYEANPEPRPNVTVDQLGEWIIEGVAVTGTRSTFRPPDRATGGSGPLVSGETWFSLELRLAILTIDFDPKIGLQTTRLTKIKRSEPDASLFLPPDGYAIVDEDGPFTVTFKKQ
jgi:hypothetical protein